MSKNLYMVPYDFTPASQKALEYALHIGKNVDTEIKLLHLAKDKPKGLAMRNKLEEVAKSTKVPARVQITTLVKVGNIFTDIGKIAKQEHAQLIIMGTHGKRGMQRLFGSFAMKIIISADCPFLIVQKNTELNEIKNVAVPIDLTKESLQITKIAGEMARIFNADLHVLAEKQTDEILHTRLKNRLGIVTQQYEDLGVKPKIGLVKKSGSYRKKIMNYSKKNKIDMIALAYHSERLFPQFDNFAQGLLTNKPGLPILIINSKLASSLYF
ncbi:MAG: universal stress protein [Crocinitomicaceae bacterium]|nr:universal stress protein [Crocinitomicaceae bacterium]